jgi:type VI secretion system secreted protein Hcp
MAADIFLKIDGIKGESTDSKHKDEIEVTSFSIGGTQVVSIAGGGMGAGKVELQPFMITKHLDKATPALFQHLATGKHIPVADFSQRKAGGEQKDFLKINLKDVLVSNWSTGGSGELPQESWTLHYGQISFEYFQQDNKGAVTSAGKFGWDLKQNKTV